MEMIGILPSYNTMKCQPQSMSGTLPDTCHKLSATVNVRYWNVGYISYGRYTWNCQVLKC